MNGMTSNGRQAAASGHARRAASQAPPGSYVRSRGPIADMARVTPFAAGWPLQSFLELGAFPGARLRARQVLWEWGLAALSDNSELVIAELLTNAIQISRAAMQDAPPPIRLWLVSDKAQVVILVWDASPLTP